MAEQIAPMLVLALCTRRVGWYVALHPVPYNPLRTSCLRHPSTACGLAAGRETEVQGNEPLEISDYT
jgi:hypothetical protein